MAQIGGIIYEPDLKPTVLFKQHTLDHNPIKLSAYNAINAEHLSRVKFLNGLL